jgi:hypothetical protein
METFAQSWVPGRLRGALSWFASPQGRAVTDPVFAELMTVVEDLAKEAARLPAEIAIEELNRLVEGLVVGRLEDQRIALRRAAADALARQVTAENEANALHMHADGAEEASFTAEHQVDLCRAQLDAANTIVEEQDAQYEDLPFLTRVALRFAWIGVPATAAGVGALVHLALPGVDDLWARGALVGASIAATLLAEMLIGTLGADVFQSINPAHRIRAIVLAIVVVLASVFATEGFAVAVRDESRQAQAEAIKFDENGNLNLTEPLSPSLLWTAPLAILLTIAGAGSIGLNSLREQGAPTRTRLKEAKHRRREAEHRLRDAERRPEEHRERASRLRGDASRVIGTATSQVTRVEALSDALDAETRRHDAWLAALSAKVRIGYYVAADERADGTAQANKAATVTAQTVQRVGASLGLAGMAGATVALLGAPLAVVSLAACAVIALILGFGAIKGGRS